MFLNLLATALVLCILGVVFLLVAYVTALAILLFIPWTQAYLVFAHWLRLQNPARLLTPEAYTLRPFATRTIYISTPDGLRLGAWHILPLSTPRTSLEKIHAIVTQHTRAGSTTAQEGDLATTDSVFEDALINAERVVLYFHGQAGDRGKANRISAYQGIQRAMPSAHVVTIDCRGYGDSEGFPSEAGFKVDALTAWSWITKRVEAHKVLIYGHSLGSGIATNLCLQLEEQQIQPLALVLDAAFTSMPDMMTGYRRVPIVWPFARFPVLLNHFKLRLMDKFETVRAVETMKSPLLLIHGQEDPDVLITNSHTLFHTALTARRLQSCTKELAVTEAGEAGEAEDEMARAGLELSFQVSHSTGRHLESLNQAMTRRNIRTEASTEGTKDERPSSFGSDSGIGSEAPSGSNSAFATSPRRHGPKEEDYLASTQPTSSLSLSTPEKTALKVHHEHKHHSHHNHDHDIDHHTQRHHRPHGKDEHSQCIIQLEFPREGALEYNQEYQIGFLTVQFAVHNTCIDFEIAKEALGAFVETVEKKRWSRTATVDVLSDASKHGHHHDDLARILRRRKIGFVDQSEVPEVVE
ncbi:Protein abhd12b [Podila minutissima]|uniref:Protein abhd12b n=1 Tax=Podila minutissima TaxID=64525 RepID=A0A9P5SIW4_9FUNG|nr:Protein abhd12b [Podila minutissima]